MSTHLNNLIDASIYVSVLHKLHHIMVNGYFLMDEVRYVYSWDNEKTKEQNLNSVMKEDAVVRYFLEQKMIDGIRVENEFRSQQLKGNESDKNLGVWGEWDKADSAYREYEWVVLIYGIDLDKFRDNTKKFGIEDTGLQLSDLEVQSKQSSISKSHGKFTAHDDNSVRFNGEYIKTKPEARRLLHALIVNGGLPLSYDQIVDTIWNEDNQNEGYLENPSRKSSEIKKRINNIVSEVNQKLYQYGNKKHLISTGETSYKLEA